MVDATRKLSIPNWYAPYLEKNRIYELFHELVAELVIQKPDDHILFLKEMLYNASQSRYTPRIILLVPPFMDKYEFADLLSRRCKAVVLTEQMISASLCREFSHINTDSQKLIRCLSALMRSADIYFSGWILPDFPRSYKEAKQLQKAGILPTHVIHLIPPYSDSLYKVNPEDSDTWITYRCNLLRTVNLFKSNIKEIFVEDKKIDDIVEECMKVIHVKKRYKAPVIPRICVLGPQGSGRKTQGQLTARTFNCVHVDFENLLCQTWRADSYLGDLLRSCKGRVGDNALLLTAMIHKRILEPDCIEQGWVVSGFPNTLEDFKYFDMLDTPPNRIIFLECDFNTCRQRIINRRVNTCTGSVVTLEKDSASVDSILQLYIKDNEDNITAQHNYYCTRYEQLRKYAGGTAYLVDANQLANSVADAIADILMQPLPNTESRSSAYIPDYVSSDRDSVESGFSPNRKRSEHESDK